MNIRDGQRIFSQRRVLTTLSVHKRLSGQKARPLTSRITASEMMQKDKENDMNGFAKGRDYERYLRLSNICMTLIGFKVFLCIAYVRLVSKQYEFDHSSIIKTDWLLIFAFALHFFLVGLRLVIEKMRQERMQVIQKLSYNYQWQIFKILLSLPLCPIPWIQSTTFQATYESTSGNVATYPFKINYLLLIPAIIESIVVFIHILIFNTIYYSPRAQRVGKIYQIHHHGDLYAIKCIVKDRPFSAFGLVSGILLLISTFSMRVFEGDIPISGNNFYYYENCFWFICITITTVGYGDIAPVSDLGHIMVCLCCVWSSLNTSVITFLLVSNLSLNQNEQKSLQLLKNVDQTLERKQLCREYIRTTLYRLLMNKKYKTNFRQALEQKKMRIMLYKIRLDRKKSLSMNDLAEEMKKQFDNALINVNILSKNTKNFMDFIAHKYFVNGSKNNSILLKKTLKSDKQLAKTKPSVSRIVSEDLLELLTDVTEAKVIRVKPKVSIANFLDT